MTLHLTKMKQKIGRVGEVLAWIVVLSLVLGPWIAWFIGEPYRRHVVREGELCSPAIDGPMLNRSSLTPTYPASLSDALFKLTTTELPSLFGPKIVILPCGSRAAMSSLMLKRAS